MDHQDLMVGQGSTASTPDLVDVHIHALPRGEMCGGEVDARLETVLLGLRERGIQRAVLVPINDLSWQPVDEMNDFAERVVHEHDGIAGLVDVDISRAHYHHGIQALEAEVARRIENGLRGIKIHPQNLGAQADDWRLLPLYRLAGELGVPVMIHCHPGSGPGRIDDSSPMAIETVVRVFHKTTFLVAHLGGILYFPYMPWLNHENVYFDTSGVIESLARFHGVERIRLLLDEIGYDRIFFGSDYPTAGIDEQLAILKEVVPPEHQPGVFAENALRFGERFGWWSVTRLPPGP